MIRVTISGVTVTQKKKDEIAEDVEKCLEDILKKNQDITDIQIKVRTNP
jgi:phenylpyruvate tautomerase PptA (4-oxalocrotonate tautomerase family)